MPPLAADFVVTKNPKAEAAFDKLATTVMRPIAIIVRFHLK